MFVRFVISNFLSFDKQTEFNMLPSAETLADHTHHIYNIGRSGVVKSTAIYGANNAGKSNFVEALRSFVCWIKQGYIHTSVNRQKFRLNKEAQLQPASFAMEIFAGGQFLVYGFSLDDTSIVKEFLYETGFDAPHRIIFEHHAPKKHFHLRAEQTGTEIQAAFAWITQQLIVRQDIKDFLQALCTDPDFFTFSNKLLTAFDTGIDHLSIEKTERTQFLSAYDPEGKHPELLLRPGQIFITEKGRYFTTLENGQVLLNRISAFHHHQPFDLIEESHGTQRLLEFLPVCWSIIHQPSTIIIDEIDQHIHPVLLMALIRKLNHAKTKGQMIFTTHESLLLDADLFRKDEIWFAMKEKATGATRLYSMSDYIIENDIDPRKGYLLNRFGAIPVTASLDLLNW